ncbi:hypothetical protein U0070_015892, partial [Myodes glareolus]
PDPKHSYDKIKARDLYGKKEKLLKQLDDVKVALSQFCVAKTRAMCRQLTKHEEKLKTRSSCRRRGCTQLHTYAVKA